MKVNVLFGSLEQLRHLDLRQPDRLVLQLDIDSGFSVRASVNQQFRTLAHGQLLCQQIRDRPHTVPQSRRYRRSCPL